MFYFRDVYPGRGTLSTSGKISVEPLEAAHYLSRVPGNLPAPELDPGGRMSIFKTVLIFIGLIILLQWRIGRAY